MNNDENKNFQPDLHKAGVSSSASVIWTIKRYIVEEFEVTAATRDEEKMMIEDPSRITVTKETIKRKHYH